MDMNYSSVIYWVMVNSTYSSDYRPIGMLRGSDKVFAIGQRTHNDITSQEIPNLMQASMCDINAYYLDIGVNGTVDRYQENAM